jgi:hypothetical protein
MRSDSDRFIHYCMYVYTHYRSEEGIAKALDAAAPDRAGLLVVHTFDLLMTAVNAGVKDAELWSETGVTLCSMLANMLIKNPGQAAEASHTACGKSLFWCCIEPFLCH